MKKEILFATIIVILTVSTSKSQDTSFVNSKIASFQAKVQREVEKSIDVYADILYPANDYLERFLFFTLDSTGRKVEKFYFIDSYGKIDSVIQQKNIDKLVFYWKDFLPNCVQYNKYLFVQPVSIRRMENPEKIISTIPNIQFPVGDSKVKYVLLFPQISIWVGKPVQKQ